MKKNSKKIAFVAALVMIASFLVPSFQSAYAAPKAEVQQAKSQSTVVNINKASLEELQVLRGVGPAIAGRILQYRQEHGRFERAEDLVGIRGIGEAKFAKIKSQISV